MPRNPTTGVFARVDNSFSDPVFGTPIDPSDADALFDDFTNGLNSLPDFSTTPLVGEIPIANGGTGQSTASTGFDALSPTTTRGDIIFRNATTNTRLPAGTAGYFLQANGAGTDPSYAGFLQNGTGAATRTWLNKARDVISVKDFGATGNGTTVTATISITSGAAALTATGAAFAASDVGKLIVVPGAGAAGAPLATTISAFTDATHVTLAANAGTTLSAVSTAITYGTDDTSAIQAALNAFQGSGTLDPSLPFYYATATIYFPAGIYCTSSDLVWRAGTSLQLSGGARIKAMSSAVTAVIKTDISAVQCFTKIIGGLIDASDLAQYAIWPQWFANISIKDLTTYSPLSSHIELGNSSGASSYEAMIDNVVCRRGLGAPFPSNLVGIHFQFAGDSHISNTIIMGVKYGITGSMYDSKLDRVHVWPLATNQLTSGFAFSGSQNILTQCQVDGIFATGGSGYQILSGQNILVGCSVNNAGTNSANQASAVFISAGASDCTIIGCTFKGDGTSQLAKDVDGDTTNLVYIGNKTSFCTTTLKPRLGQGSYLASGSVGSGDFTVATLPSSPTRGDRAFVHDATVTTFASVVVGGGSNWVPVVYNGANWIIG